MNKKRNLRVSKEIIKTLSDPNIGSVKGGYICSLTTSISVAPRCVVENIK